MKTTLTLEDVEGLEELREKAFYSHHATSALNNKMHELLPLILPVIREYVKGNPEGLPLPQGASPPVHSDVSPDWPHYTYKCNWCGDIHTYMSRNGKGWDGRSRCPKCDSPEYTHGFFPIPSPSDASSPYPLPEGVEQVKASQEGSVCEVEPLGEMEATTRGFEIIHFEDRNGEACSLQQSSLADYEPPGSSAVWLGTDRRMHLTISQVEKLVAHLQAWVETGSFRLVPRGGAADQP